MTSKNILQKVLLLILATSTVLLTAITSYAHSGSLNKVALEVCKQKEKSQACQYNGGHSDLYIGTCQLISETDLICVRNQPIKKIESAKTASEKEHKQ